MTDQKSREVFYFQIPVLAVDLCLLALSWGIMLHLIPLHITAEVTVVDGRMEWTYALLGLSFLNAVGFFGLRIAERNIRYRTVALRAALMVSVAYLILTVLLGMIFKIVPRTLLVSSYAISLILVTACHMLARKLVRILRGLGRNTRHVAIVGVDGVTRRLYSDLTYGQDVTGYRVAGFFSATDATDTRIPEGTQLLGSTDDFFSWIATHHVDELYCSLPPAMYKDVVNRIIKVCNEQFVDFYYVPRMDGYAPKRMAIQQFGSVTVIKMREEPLGRPISRLLKRSVDIIVSGLFLLTLYPWIYLVVACITKLTSPGPVYFRQTRTGYNGKTFRIYKFRSMKVNADSDKLQATEDDPRKTRFGDFLRRSSIDELPQFINVLLGDMSIIGPRPHMEYHTEIYRELVGDYMVRHHAKPGITGWAQVNGCRGETRTVEEMKARVEHDIWYIEHWTPLLDLRIFVRTIMQLLPGRDKQAY